MPVLLAQPAGPTPLPVTLTRNQLIERAYRDLSVLAQDETLEASLLQDGIDSLNLILREEDAHGKTLNAEVTAPESLTLVAATSHYTQATGVPDNIVRLTAVQYRDSSSQDWPVTIIDATQYSAIQDKALAGPPTMLYLTQDAATDERELYIWPVPASVTTEKIRLTYRRPLADFLHADDNPDLPQAWTHYLLFCLEEDLGHAHGLSLPELQWLRSKKQEAYLKMFPGLMPSTQAIHNKARYF